jgi:hypothetical protein
MPFICPFSIMLFISIVYSRHKCVIICMLCKYCLPVSIWLFILQWGLLLLCWVGVHCGICKCYYNVSNISYLNLPPPLLSLIPPLPESRKQWGLLERKILNFWDLNHQFVLLWAILSGQF